jgi:serine acetyltransferase
MYTVEKNQFREKCIALLVEILHPQLKKYSIPIRINDEDIFAFAEDVINGSLWYDIERFIALDPAIKSAYDPYSYAGIHKGVVAIIYYRLANHLIYSPHLFLSSDDDDDDDDDVYFDPLERKHNTSKREEIKGCLHQIARDISEKGARETTIEINPATQIGKGLIIDHGTNTMIKGGIVAGETCVIGENFTILNGAVLGVSEIYGDNQQEGRRHPKIGNGVTICAGVRILGPVTIGDNVTIAPYCVITSDIPSDHKVSIVNQLQIEPSHSPADSREKMIIWGLVPDESKFHLYGKNLCNVELSICSSNAHCYLLDVNIISRSNTKVTFEIIHPKSFVLPEEGVSLCINSDKQAIYLLNPPAIIWLLGRDK